MSYEIPWRHIADVGKEAIDYVEKRKTGEISSLKTKWEKFNYVTLNGIEWQSIITIAGMSSSGKTLILNELETSLFEKNPGVDFIVLSNNYEMLSRNLIIRKLSSKFKLTHKRILSADGNKLDEGILEMMREYVDSELAKYKIFYVDLPHSVDGIQEMIQQMYAKYKLPIVVTIDHSILVKKSKDEAGHLDVLYKLGEMQSTVKKLLPVTFINLSQLNREIESEGRRKPGTVMNYPTKLDIYGADALYQHSDIVLVNHRPALLYLPYYGPDKEKVHPDDIYWHILKNRSGEPCVIRMEADFKNMRINEV